jgi:hypothetical protein
MSLERIASMYEAPPGSTLFPHENSASF